MYKQSTTPVSVVRYPTASLSKLSHAVTAFDAELAAFTRAMNETMIEENGIGLAAPQIGRNIRLIIVKIGEGTEYATYVNPVITFRSKKFTAIEEGCLSVHGVFGYVERYAKVHVQYQDLKGIKHLEKAKGMQAIVLQHEIDHINGLLIINRPIQITKGEALMNRWNPPITKNE